MTAINVVRFQNVAHVAVDGLSYEADGDRYFNHRLCEKVHLVPHFPMAVACRGAENGAAHVGDMCREAFGSFDQLVENMAVTFPVMHRMHCETAVCQMLEVFVVGWSSRRERAEAYAIRSDDKEGAYPAWALHEIKGVHYAPWPPSFGKAQALKTAKEDGVRSHMLAVMEQQRADFPKAVGGFCQLVSVSENALTSRILRRWPLPGAAAVAA